MPRKIKTTANKLYRSSENKIIAGVCGGIGEYFNIDPVFIRIIFIILFLSHGSGLLIYLILWLVIPKKESLSNDVDDTVRSNFKEIKEIAKKHNSKQIIGFFLVILGIAFLLDNFYIVNFDYIWRFWPVILIIIGYIILTRHENK